MPTGTPTYPTTIDTDTTLGATSGIVSGVTHTGDTGAGQGSLSGIIKNLINTVIALETQLGVSTHRGQATVAFGSTDPGVEIDASVTVAASWVARATSIIDVNTTNSSDHPGDDAMCEQLAAYVVNIIDGVSFDIVVRAPLGTWGNWAVNYYSN